MTGAAISPGIVLAAIFLPPLALFLAGGVSRNFWICFGLTCLGYLLAFAFYTLLNRRAAAPEPR